MLGMNMVAYMGTRIFTTGRYHYNIESPLDRMLPLVPFFVIFYVLAFAQWITGYLLIGREKNARLVGRALRRAELYGDYPCHRVVNHAGRLALHFPEQRALLLAEGVGFLPNGCVDMKAYQWEL